MKIIRLNSPNFDSLKRSIKSVKIIVIHYTGMQSERESLIRLCNPKSKVSAHFVIGKNGKIYNLVAENRIAWHAGKSYWGKYKNLNKNSIGIELINKGHEFGYTIFKKKQISSLIWLCTKIIKKYKIKKKYIVGHSDIAPLRKMDPGEKFPWEELALKNIGIWHNYKINILKKFRKVKISQNKKLEFIKDLNNIGYRFFSNNKASFTKTIKAFQRRYRKELVNGLIDKECMLIAENLSKKI
jgi:N-acetylmuramoyl-L-alanine amidase